MDKLFGMNPEMSDERVSQLAPAHRGLDRRNPGVAESNLIPRFGFRAVAMQARESLLSELDRRRQAVPLGVDTRPGRLFRVAAQRQTAAAERAIEEVEEDILSQSLLEKAGLEKPRRPRSPGARTGEIGPADFLLADDE